MKESVAIEVNKIEWQKGSTLLHVLEAKMQGETPTRDEYYYYRYQWVSGLQTIGTSVLRQWFTDYKRTPAPKSEWAMLAIVKGNLSEEIKDSAEPDDLP